MYGTTEFIETLQYKYQMTVKSIRNDSSIKSYIIRTPKVKVKKWDGEKQF